MKRYILFVFCIILAACKDSNDTPDAYGNFECEETMISSEVNGKLLLFELQEGSVVDSGVLVGLVDTTDLVLKKEQLKAQKEVVSAKSAGIISQVEVQEQQKINLLVDKARIEKLLQENAATKKQLDDIEGNLKVIDKQILSIATQNAGIINEMNSLEKQIAQTDLAISKCKIVNPLKGTILNKFVQKNELVVMGKVLYKIADLEYLYFRGYISENQLLSVKIGQQVEVNVDGSQGDIKKYPGTLIWISSVAEFTPKVIQTREERVNLVYAIKIKVKNDGSLKIGMPGEVIF